MRSGIFLTLAFVIAFAASLVSPAASLPSRLAPLSVGHRAKEPRSEFFAAQWGDWGEHHGWGDGGEHHGWGDGGEHHGWGERHSWAERHERREHDWDHEGRRWGEWWPHPRCYWVRDEDGYPVKI